MLKTFCVVMYMIVSSYNLAENLFRIVMEQIIILTPSIKTLIMKEKLTFRYLKLLIAAVLVTNSALAQMVISTNTTWSSNQILTQDVVVNAGATLTINPGVLVQAVFVDVDNNSIGDVGITVNGKLNIKGTVCSPVKFEPYQATTNMNYWEGIVINSLTNNDSLRYFEMKYANRGLEVQSQATVHGAKIRYCPKGVYNTSTGNLTLNSSRIHLNGGSGIFNSDGSVNVINSRIDHNGRFGITNSSGSMTMSFCDVDSNTWGGIYIGGVGNNDIQNSTILGNTGSGVEISEWKFLNELPSIGTNEGIPTIVATNNNIIGNASTSYQLTQAETNAFGTIPNWGVPCNGSSDFSPINSPSATYEIPIGGLSYYSSKTSRFSCGCGQTIYHLRNAYTGGTIAAWQYTGGTVCANSSNDYTNTNVFVNNTFVPTDKFFMIGAGANGSRYTSTNTVHRITIGGYEVYSSVGNSTTFNFTNNYWGVVVGVNNLVKDVNTANINYAGYSPVTFANAHSNIPDGSPVVNLGPDGAICQGNTLTLDAQNSGASFTWSTGATTQTISVNSAGSYFVTVNNGCGIKKDTINITVNPLPGTASAPSGQTLLCQNASNSNYVTSGSSNATSYAWSVSPVSAGIISGTGTTGAMDWDPSFSGTATITVKGVNSCGQSTSGATVNVTINPIAATPGAISGSSVVCAGAPYTYSVVNDPGALSYTWTLPSGWSGSSTSNTINTTATSNAGTITVIANNNCGSSSAATLTVSSGSISQPGTISGNSSVCMGTSQTFSVAPVAGASSYNWTLPSGWSGSSSTNSITATVGSNSGTVSVAASNACGTTAASSFSVTSNSLPAINTSGATSICAGSSTTLTASGAGTYSWMPGSLSGASVSVSPSSNTTYTVTGTDANGCIATQTAAVTINALPVISTSGSSTVCAGSTTTSLSASGGAVYSWMPGNINGSAITVSPTGTTTYTVTGIEAVNGCSNTATATITVNALPNISATGGATVCASQTANLFASGGTSYNWSPAAGLSSTTGSVVAATPASTTTYTVTGLGSNGCSNTATVTVTVTPQPNIQISAPTAVCLGSSASLQATGASSYSWMPGGLSGSSVSVSPSANTSYTVTGTDNGCSSTQTILLTVNQLPAVTTNADMTICAGNSASLTASGATVYSWMPGSLSGASVPVSPAGNTTYTVTGTDGNGCASTSAVNVAIENVVVSANGITVCEDSTATLSASGAATYTWNPGNLSGSSVSVNPVSTTTYTVVGTSALGCTATTTAMVTIDALAAPIINASGTSLSIANTTLAIQWYLNGNPIAGATSSAYNALVNGNYTVCVTNANNCQGCSAASVVSSVGINESVSAVELKVVPNPNNGIFSLKGSVNNENVQILIVDILGNEIQAIDLGSVNGEFTQPLNLASQADGLYFVKLKTSNGEVVRKMIKD